MVRIRKILSYSFQKYKIIYFLSKGGLTLGKLKNTLIAILVGFIILSVSYSIIGFRTAINRTDFKPKLSLNSPWIIENSSFHLASTKLPYDVVNHNVETIIISNQLMSTNTQNPYIMMFSNWQSFKIYIDNQLIYIYQGVDLNNQIMPIGRQIHFIPYDKDAEISKAEIRIEFVNDSTLNYVHIPDIRFGNHSDLLLQLMIEEIPDIIALIVVFCIGFIVMLYGVYSSTKQPKAKAYALFGLLVILIITLMASNGIASLLFIYPHPMSLLNLSIASLVFVLPVFFLYITQYFNIQRPYWFNVMTLVYIVFGSIFLVLPFFLTISALNLMKLLLYIAFGVYFISGGLFLIIIYKRGLHNLIFSIIIIVSIIMIYVTYLINIYYRLNLPIGIIINLIILITLIYFMNRFLNRLKTDQANVLSGEREAEIKRMELLWQDFNGVYFDWNILDRSCYWGGNYLKYFGAEMPKNDFPKSVFSKKYGVMDHPDIDEVFREIEGGSAFEKREIQFVDPKGEVKWYELSVTTIYGDSHIPVRALGVIDDITDKKAMSLDYETSLEEMEVKLMMDPLTNLYNKVAIQQKIIETTTNSALVGDNQQHVMFMFDMDDFKNINDSFGHAFGDSVIKEFAEVIKDSFRANDWVGRVGGDEFMVLMRNVKDIMAVELKAQEIIDKCKRSYDIEGIKVSLNVSVGIAIFPLDGVEYDTLYQHVDEALYDAKARGKGVYSFYQKSFGRINHIETNEPLLVNYKITGQIQETIYQNMADAKSFDQAINQVIQIIGKRFYASQVLVYLNHGEDQNYTLQYDWRSGVYANYTDMYTIPLTVIEEYQNMFTQDETLIYYSSLNLKEYVHSFYHEQGIDGMVQSLLKFEGSITGLICVIQGDDNWRITQHMLDWLSISSQIFSRYFNLQQVRHKDVTKIDVLNDLHKYKGEGYVVNRHYQVIFINETLKKVDSNLQLGDLCYKKLKGLPTICTDCPIRNIHNSDNYSGNSLVNHIFDKNWMGWADSCAIKFQWSDTSDAFAIKTIDIDSIFTKFNR